MTDKLIGTLGLLTTIIFIAGFITLFIYNPITYEELNNISLTQYNLIGMNGRLWLIYVNYITVGLLICVLTIGLFAITKNNSIIVAGKILLLVSGCIWTSFGLIPYDMNTEFGNQLMTIRTMAILLTGSIGLIILGAEFEQILKDKFLKYYTLTTAGTILLIGTLSIFVFWDETWIRTNISLTIYFIWFGVFGLRFLQKKPAPNNVFASSGVDA
jgi:hypothetical protein